MADHDDEAEEVESFRALGKITRAAIDRAVAPLLARIAELEGKCTMNFCGSFDPSKGYPRGSVVQKAGGAWVAMVDTRDVPGASTEWRRIATDRA